MSKKIVIDKDDWEKIAQEFNSNDLPKFTEIDTDQSIDERAEKCYPKIIGTNSTIKDGLSSNWREVGAYIKGATEQDLISKAREKELEEKIKRLEFMIENGLGYEDLKNDI